MFRKAVCIKLPLLLILVYYIVASIQDHAKDNGDIYVQHKQDSKCFNNLEREANATIPLQISNSTGNELEDVVRLCNSSFSIPTDHIMQFNTDGALADTVDKTGMCFIRCYFEKSGLIQNWKLNKDQIVQKMWPLAADSVDFCESEAKQEMNACVRTYAIAKCLMQRRFEGTCNPSAV
ncbi:general odorant-binding protein 84a [Ceratitis capitata]|uniref:general odorant-binding protein 84a n=1 Tax=Ceratitis capitata TaxID=7213 RepID=UPI000329F311|nr:general odorant-binding protein 84a [Ceratitis capitata]